MHDHASRGNLVRSLDRSRGTTRKALRIVLAALTAAVLVVLAAIPAGAMTVTWIRHGESEGNASGYINTEAPGPELTARGVQEAAAVYTKLLAQGVDPGLFDAIYTSTMIRTQQTAEPLAGQLGLRPTIIGSFDPANPRDVAGIQEISAGIFEGSPEAGGIGRLGLAFIPLGWALGLRFLRIPGSEDGNELDARVDAALAQMKADGEAAGDVDINAVAFSHGGTIMFWTLMNVDNPNLLLMLQSPLKNTDVVVVDENGEGGWTLKSWAGQPIGPANYPTQMFVNVRDLVVAPQTAIHNLRQPVLDLDTGAIVSTAGQGVRDVGDATVKFVADSVTDTVNAIRGLIPNPSMAGTFAAKSPKPADKVGTKIAEQLTEVRSEVAATLAGKRSAAADLKSANKKVADARDQVRKAVTDVRDNVRKAVKDTRDTVRKAAA